MPEVSLCPGGRLPGGSLRVEEGRGAIEALRAIPRSHRRLFPDCCCQSTLATPKISERSGMPNSCPPIDIAANGVRAWYATFAAVWGFCPRQRQKGLQYELMRSGQFAESLCGLSSVPEILKGSILLELHRMEEFQPRRRLPLLNLIILPVPVDESRDSLLDGSRGFVANVLDQGIHIRVGVGHIARLEGE